MSPSPRRTTASHVTAARFNSRQRATHQSLRDVAYDAIKHRIITCSFKPGQRIDEISVSELLGLGRTPVHQALDRLMLDELVEVIPRKGVIVKPVIVEDIMQMVDVRLINETHCARLAAMQAGSNHVDALGSIVRKARKAIAAQDVNGMMMLDREFHQTLGQASGNTELAKILRKLNERSLRFWFISFTTPDHHRRFQRQHEAVVAAVHDKDPDAAEHAMRDHIEAFRKSVTRQL